MSRARHWRERCGEAIAARVTLPKATPPDFLFQRVEPGCGAAEAGVGSIR
jgi:hypothetical protein